MLFPLKPVKLDYCFLPCPFRLDRVPPGGLGIWSKNALNMVPPTYNYWTDALIFKLTTYCFIRLYPRPDHRIWPLCIWTQGVGLVSGRYTSAWIIERGKLRSTLDSLHTYLMVRGLSLAPCPQRLRIKRLVHLFPAWPRELLWVLPLAYRHLSLNGTRNMVTLYVLTSCTHYRTSLLLIRQGV